MNSFPDFINKPWEVKGIPYVYTSEQKWGFLQNGAIECLKEVHFKPKVDSPGSRYESKQWLLINCLNSPVGRYVAFVFPKSPDRYQTDRFFISDVNIKQFISTKGNCYIRPGRIAQSVARLTQDSGSIPGPTAYFRFSFR